ncbi:ABC transporter ATP-binding protein [Thermoproteota archaeon]
MNTIEVKNLGKKYNLNQEKRTLVKDILKGFLGFKAYKDFWALRNVNFTVRKGETLGIIGENGSGKSTLLRILSGVTRPTEGEIEIKGKIASLLELGAGFHPDLTGRENIYINAAILGLHRRQIDEKFDSIVDFAEIGDFIDAPIKTYSSGMQLRLGFAVAINVDPDILLIDEVLAVGDASFQRKCLTKLNEFKKEEKTLIFISHDLDAISAICDRAILMGKSKLLNQGNPRKVISQYMLLTGNRKGITEIESGPLQVIFNNGRLYLLWEGEEITRGQGGMSSILTNIWHNSTEADWEIKGISEKQITAVGKWRRLPLSQVWNIIINNENEIEWSIEMEIQEQMIIRKYNTNLLLSTKYQEWHTSHESGNFPEIRPGEEWVHLDSKKFTNKFIGVKECNSSEGFLPSVTINLKEGKFIDTILNADYPTTSRVLQRLKAVPPEKNKYEPGKFNDFEGTIQIGK